jgi:hypothetical protein
LVAGNFMNAGSSNGVPGFKASFLSKVIDIKATSNGSSLVDVISSIVYNANPEYANFIVELAPLKNLKSVSLKGIEDELSHIKKDYQLVEKELEISKRYHELPKYHRKDAVFASKLDEFHKDICGKVEFLQKEYKDLIGEKGKVYEYFGEPVNSKLGLEALVSHLDTFASAFEKSFAQIQRNRISPRKLPAKEIPKKEVQANRSSMPSKENRHLDSLLENLKNRPALESFEMIQKPKLKDETKKHRNTTPTLAKLTRGTSTFSEDTWKILDILDFDNLGINLSSVNK